MRFVFCSLNIGSMAKQFTAMTILLLQKDKKLAVDDDVHKYLQGLRHQAVFNRFVRTR